MGSKDVGAENGAALTQKLNRVNPESRCAALVRLLKRLAGLDDR